MKNTQAPSGEVVKININKLAGKPKAAEITHSETERIHLKFRPGDRTSEIKFPEDFNKAALYQNMSEIKPSEPIAKIEVEKVPIDLDDAQTLSELEESLTRELDNIVGDEDDIPIPSSLPLPDDMPIDTSNNYDPFGDDDGISAYEELAEAFNFKLTPSGKRPRKEREKGIEDIIPVEELDAPEDALPEKTIEPKKKDNKDKKGNTDKEKNIEKKDTAKKSATVNRNDHSKKDNLEEIPKREELSSTSKKAEEINESEEKVDALEGQENRDSATEETKNKADAPLREAEDLDGDSIKGFKWIVAAMITVFLLTAGYITCCMLVNEGHILGHTYVEDVDLINMSRAVAQKTVNDLYESKYADLSIDVSINGETYNINVSDAVISPAAEITREAFSFGHGLFFTRGGAYIKSLFSKRELSLLPRELDSTRLLAAIDASGIIEDHSGSSANWRLDEDSLVITKSSVKREIDTDSLMGEMQEAILSGSIDSVLECPFVEKPAEETDLQAIYDEMYTEPQNATLDPEKDYAIVDSIDGLSFDLAEAKNILASAGEGETVKVPLIHTKADISSEDLKKNLFRDELGTYTTNVRGTADRRSNVKLAGSKCAKIMLPGEVFSYNETVGKRTEEAGFSKAAAYQNGNTVQELGGGICQASSTLYNAVMCANLEITERHNHSFASAYVPLGQDATVSWGGPDFKFTNNTDYPIRIDEEYVDDKITFTIVGTNLTGEYCTVTHETLSTNPYQVIEQPSDMLFVGESKRAVEGETGYRVKTYRHLFSADGTEISVTEEDTSNYIRRDEVRLVGTRLPDDIMAAFMNQLANGNNTTGE